MKDILFKAKDNKFYINVPEELNNQQFLESLKGKIERLLIFKDVLKQNVILNIDKRKLNDREILQLFDILIKLDSLMKNMLLDGKKIDFFDFEKYGNSFSYDYELLNNGYLMNDYNLYLNYY